MFQESARIFRPALGQSGWSEAVRREDIIFRRGWGFAGVFCGVREEVLPAPRLSTTGFS